jgi:hypothetical protein
MDPVAHGAERRIEKRVGQIRNLASALSRELEVTSVAARSHSQKPTWSWKVSTSQGFTMCVWYRSP